MASIVLGVAGAIVGSFFGMPQVGWALGSALGSALFQPDGPENKSYGPRLGDLRAQRSMAGGSIPEVHGSARIAGNMIWADNIVEVVTVTESETEGKGGGGSSSSSTTYTYFQSFAIGICEGPISGIRRIWANGILVYSTVDAASTYKSGAIREAMRVYTGTDTQIPSSVIQASMGIADTPAYRGTAYVVFNQLALESFSNRTPSFEFEVIGIGSVSNVATLMYSTDKNAPSYPINMWVHKNELLVATYYYSDFAGNTAYTGNSIYAGTSDVLVYNISNPLKPVLKQIVQGGFTGSSAAMTPDGKYLITFTNSNNRYNVYAKLDQFGYPSKTWEIYGYFTSATLIPTIGASNRYLIGVYSGNNTYVCRIDLSAGLFPFVPLDLNSSIDVTPYEVTGGDMRPIFNASGTLCVMLDRFRERVLILDVHAGVLVSTIVPAGVGFNGVSINTIFKDDYYLIIGRGKHLSTYYLGDPYNPVLLNTPTDSLYPNYIGDGVYFAFSDSFEWYSDDILLVSTLVNGGQYSVYAVDITDIANPVVRGTKFSSLWLRVGVYHKGLIYSCPNSSFTSASLQVYVLTIDAPTPSGVTVKSVVDKICLDSGIPSTYIDTSLITGNVWGYSYAQSTGRAKLEPVLEAYNIDAIESSGKIKFLPRSIAQTPTRITSDSLVPSSSLFTIDYTNDMELPKEVIVGYINYINSYQDGSQRASRYTTNSRAIENVEIPISLLNSEAANIANTILYARWLARTTIECVLHPKYAYIDPTDILSINLNGRDYVIRVTESSIDNLGNKIKGEVVDNVVYTQDIPPAVELEIISTITTYPICSGALLDIPLLKSSPSGSFIAYQIGYNTSDTWYGAKPYISIDNETTWVPSSTVIKNNAIVGYTINTLETFNTRNNIFDETNSVLIELAVAIGTLSSLSELQVLNGGNLMLVGSELLQFKNAELISAGVYKLSGLLRGRFGTEAYVGTHTPMEDCILLNSSTTYEMPLLISDISRPISFKAVGIGTAVDNTSSYAITYTGVSAKPYSPVLLGGGRNTATADIVLTWVRRARLNASWANNTDVPLGEASELYDVEIFTSNTYATIKRTITDITTNTVGYSAAQQISDFGGYQTTLYFKVYQKSAVFGRGFEAVGQI
jgi:hypothetical protein